MPKSTPNKKNLENQLKRALADYQNLVKQTAKDRQDLIRFSSAAIIKQLLPVLDDLNRVQSYLKDHGLALTINKFLSVLNQEGLEELNLLNKIFDPQTAECVELAPGPKNTVVEVITKGYALNGQILRPARVKVGQGG